MFRVSSFFMLSKNKYKFVRIKCDDCSQTASLTPNRKWCWLLGLSSLFSFSHFPKYIGKLTRNAYHYHIDDSTQDIFKAVGNFIVDSVHWFSFFFCIGLKFSVVNIFLKGYQKGLPWWSSD